MVNFQAIFYVMATTLKAHIANERLLNTNLAALLSLSDNMPRVLNSSSSAQINSCSKLAAIS